MKCLLLMVAILAIFAAVQSSLLAPAAAVAVRSDSALTYNLDNQKAAAAVPVGYYGPGVLGYGGLVGAAPYGLGLGYGGVYGLGAVKAYGLGLGYGHLW